jgi:hypothetical protein
MDEKKELTRREFLGFAAAAAALALLPGCEPAAYSAGTQPGRTRSLANAAYPSAYAPGQPYAVVPQTVTPNYIVVEQPSVIQAVYTPPQAEYRQPVAARRPAAAPSAGAGKLKAVSRQSWAVTPPNPQKMRPMNGVTRLTVHHEGSAKPNNDATATQVAATLRRIQGQHGKRMGAGDIGYHFIIDRTGTIWQGRDWRYQGAHTSGANANNIGVMLLGNFEIQQPTGLQLSAMRDLVLSLARMYNLDLRKDIYAHNDFGNTQCPGKHLKPHVQAFKLVR